MVRKRTLNLERSLERCLQTALLALLASGYLALALSGELDRACLVAGALVLAARAAQLTGLVRFIVPERWASRATACYLLFVPADYLLISRDLIPVSYTHLIGEGGIDRLIGFVHVRDLYELDDEQRKTKTIRELMREIEGVPETKPVPELLREMQTDGRHIVYVVNEYGNVAGIATLEDLFEEVFGEIFDEHEPARDFERGPDGSITLSGSCRCV